MRDGLKRTRLYIHTYIWNNHQLCMTRLRTFTPPADPRQVHCDASCKQRQQQSVRRILNDDGIHKTKYTRYVLKTTLQDGWNRVTVYLNFISEVISKTRVEVSTNRSQQISTTYKTFEKLSLARIAFLFLLFIFDTMNMS